MKSGKVSISSLVPFDENPRFIEPEDLDKLAESLSRFGLYKPLLVWRDDEGKNVVIGGNQRLKVLLGMGVEEVPVVWFQGSRAEAVTVAMRDNNHDGEWNFEELSEYIETMDSELVPFTGLDENWLSYSGLEDASSDQDLEEEERHASNGEVSETEQSKVHKFRIGDLKFEVNQQQYEAWQKKVREYQIKVNSTSAQSVLKAMLGSFYS